MPLSNDVPVIDRNYLSVSYVNLQGYIVSISHTERQAEVAKRACYADHSILFLFVQPNCGFILLNNLESFLDQFFPSIVMAESAK